jgi:putative Holliday junction resolvase
MKLLALDVGERRIGVAVSDETGLLATPLTTIRRASKVEDFARIAGLIREQQAQGVVIGHPLNRDGSAGPQARRVQKYAQALGAALHDEGPEVPVILWDEYLSTRQAEEALVTVGRRSRARRGRAGLDAAAAAIILREYLEARPH